MILSREKLLLVNINAKEKKMIMPSNIPDLSVLKSDEHQYDYVDSFEGEFVDAGGHIRIEEIGRSFFQSSPGWVGWLFTLRNRFVGLLGLKTSGRVVDNEQQVDSFKFEPGNQIGLFKVFDRTENEVVLGEDDKHLNFRVSLFLAEDESKIATKILIISTTVIFNNWLGQLYFLPVRPFHRLIVPAMLKGTLKKLEHTGTTK